MNQVAIVIPVYKEVLNELETSSLKQLIKVLGHYPITFVTHNGLNTQRYTDLCTGVKVEFDYFDKIYFEGIWGYNRLLISKNFYTRFLANEFILIYQLDAWVFKDQLKEWCNSGFDYIGAPVYEGYSQAGENADFLGIGNGGLSLRRVAAYVKVLNRFSFIRSFNYLKLANREGAAAPKRSGLKLAFDFLFRNNTFHLLNKYDHNEDTFWGKIIPSKFSWFKVPDEFTASRFSMEVKAPFLYKVNNNTLPFGCHAWEKYHTDFWAQFIPVS